MEYYIYILRCQGDTLYTGITVDLKKRMRQHCGLCKGGAKYTRSHPPKEIMAVWQAESQRGARQFEAYCKQLPRSEKLKLIASPSQWATWISQECDGEIVPFTFLSLEEYLQK